MTSPKTSDGYAWDRQAGVRPGLESDAVVTPPRSVRAATKVYDAIVVGAGYAGLAAARDLVKLSAFFLGLPLSGNLSSSG